MEGETDMDAACVPPRSEAPNIALESVTHDNKDNVLEQSSQIENVNNQEITIFEEEETKDQTNAGLSDVLPPTDTWSFNKLLLDIADALTADEFNRMKLMYEGEIGYGSMEKITSPSHLFSVLRKRGFLSSINLIYLCALLHIAERLDLLQSVAEYSRKTEDALYVYPPSLTPVNGYTHIKFHVAGRDFTQTTNKQLRDFRKIVSAVLTVPEQFVIIDGITPASSITVTLLLPEKHATILQNMLEKNELNLIHLIIYGVDTVVVDGKTYTIQEVISPPTDEKVQKQMDFYLQLQRAKCALSDTESENLTLKEKMKYSESPKLKQKLKKLEKKVMELQAENDVWIRSVKPSNLFPDAENGVSQRKDELTIPEDIAKALENFRISLSKMSDAEYDKQLVLKLLQAHVTLIAARCYHELSAIIAKSEMMLMNVLHGIVMVETQAEVHRFMGFLEVNRESVVRALRKISMKISPEEQKKLQVGHQWTEEDREYLESGTVPFLIMLMHKEAKQESGEGEQRVNVAEFVQKCLTKIDRLDLLPVFLEEASIPVSTEKISQNPDVRESGTDKQERTPRHSEARRTGMDKHGDDGRTIDELVKNVELLIEKVDTIDNTINVMNGIPSVENMANIKGEYANMLYQLMTKNRSAMPTNV